MKPRMGDTIFELEQRVLSLEADLKSALAENEAFKNGEEMKRLYHRINRLTAFANDCIRWGAEPCRCQQQAEDAINEASEYNP